MTPLALLLYRLAITAAFPLAAPWLLATDRRRGKNRPPLRQRLGRDLPPLPGGGVWVQAVSVGEVTVARPLMAELRRRHPTLPLILSATTATGLALASGQQVADVIVPYPIDFPGPVRRCLDAARPRLVLLVETELWPEMLHACERRGIPVALANARISDRSYRGYRAIRRLLVTLIRPLSLAIAQSESDAERLVSLGVPEDRVRVGGNVKFDVPAPREIPLLGAALRRLAEGRPVWVAGSTMEGEEDAIADALLRLSPGKRPFLLLAPRHPERAGAVEELLARRGLGTARRSRIDSAPQRPDAVVLDTVGELAGLYGLASVAFVGGSLVATGGHNPIEPARFGVPVLSGPYVHNFKVIYRDFLAAGAAQTVHDPAELAAAVENWLDDRNAATEAGNAGRVLVERHAGATSRTVDLIERLLA